MIYAIRTIGRHQTLLEFEDEADFSTVANFHRRVSRSVAARLVTDGKEHQTGLVINDDGMVVYAPKEA